MRRETSTLAVKKFLIIIVLLFLIVPIAAHAFSLSDIFSFLKKEDKIIEAEPEPNPAITVLAEEKYKIWKDAFENKDIEIVMSNVSNLFFSEGELNYLIEKRLKDMKYPPAKEVKVFLKEGLIKIRGISKIKFFKGSFELNIKPVQKERRIVLEVKKARFKKFYFPSFVASILLKKEMDDTMAFLYSHGSVEKLKIIIIEDNLELKYEKQ